MSPLGKVEVSLSSQNDVRMREHHGFNVSCETLCKWMAGSRCARRAAPCSTKSSIWINATRMRRSRTTSGWALFWSTSKRCRMQPRPNTQSGQTLRRWAISQTVGRQVHGLRRGLRPRQNSFISKASIGRGMVLEGRRKPLYAFPRSS